MSIDVTDLIALMVGVAGAAICIVAAVRGWQIRRAQTYQVFRRRADWNIFVSVLALAFVLLGLPGVTSVPELQELDLAFFATLPLLIFAFVDSAILAAMEMDFFHRDTLGWKRLRRPFSIVELAFFSVLVTDYFVYLSSPPPLFLDITLIAVVAGLLVISYSGVALFTASRRTEDRHLKRYTKLLGVLIALGAIFLFAALTLNNLFGILLGYLLTISIPYTIYLTAMSLSQRGSFDESTVTAAK